MKSMILQSNRNLILITLIVIIISSVSVQAEISLEKKISLFFNAGPRQPALNPRWQPWVIAAAYSGGISYGMSEEIALSLNFDHSKVYNDTLSSSTYKIGREMADRYWRINNLSSSTTWAKSAPIPVR